MAGLALSAVADAATRPNRASRPLQGNHPDSATGASLTAKEVYWPRMRHPDGGCVMLVEAQPFHPRPAWNTRRVIGPKPPLKPRHIWAIRTRLQHDRRVRDLAMFNLTIDSKLRGCDLVRLRTDDVVLGGTVRLRTSITQQKTGQPVPFELTDSTREAQETAGRERRLALPQPQSIWRPCNHSPIWALARRLGCFSWPGSRALRDAQPATDKSGLDLQAHRKPAGLSVASGAFQTGKHRALPRH